MFMKTIKFLFPVLLLSLAIGFNSCSSEDPKSPEELILGTWEHDSFSFDIQTNNPVVTAMLKELFSSPEFGISTMTFSTGGKVVVNYEDGDIENFSYKFENGKLILDEMPLSYTLDNTKFSMEIYNLDAEELAEIEEIFTDVEIQKIAITAIFKKK